ncbi:pectate lyase [Pedobacter nyackensis]|uniref:Pectate lyase, PelA/Pel-15E family n=1 Tax=Pedobacter nyackensis TaxID=475255 RepID=A0A1W2F6Y0_9SPHI|nr:pectate lyase [Pedobacter nyackensis]SMD17685.1 pectate lyase, PelA/Pel-15E family [Pedobacter nyackensis]
MKICKSIIYSLTIGLSCSFGIAKAQSDTNSKGTAIDPVAENMLAYQRSVGGWPKAIGKTVVNYDKVLSERERIAIKADSLRSDATIDNKATSKEIRYLIKAYKTKPDPRYRAAVQKGVDYLLEAQYDNGGWSQYYPDHSSYRGEITYNDNAMINVLNIMQDIVEGKNDFDQLNPVYKEKAMLSVKKGVSCILKTQVMVNGKLTVWCAQYDEQTLKPAKARAFELISLSGSESVGITEFLMRIKNPSEEIKRAVNSAVKWFEHSKIVAYDFAFVEALTLPGGKDRMLVEKPGAILWARFYDIDTNEPFFSGRDSKKVKTVAEIEHERRIGYAWYGAWAAGLLEKKYPAWQKK